MKTVIPKNLTVAAMAGTGRPGCRPEADEEEEKAELMEKLQEANFLLGFVSAVNSTQEVDAVYGKAALWLYDCFQYNLLVFVPAPDSGVRARGYSSVSLERRAGEMTALCKSLPGLRPEDIYDYKTLGLPSPKGGGLGGSKSVLELPGGMGSVLLFWGEASVGILSPPLLERIGEFLSGAIANASEYGRVKELSMMDGLTGVFNRRVFQEMMEIESRRRELSPLSIFLIDLDDFKQINDSFGHPAGDMVLSCFGRFLRNCCRGADVIARYGGEEFAVMLLGTAEPEAMDIAERLRRKLDETTFIYEGAKIRVTASMGLAYTPGTGGCTGQELVRRADQALYRAKRDGKNRVCVFGKAPMHLRSLSGSGGGRLLRIPAHAQNGR